MSQSYPKFERSLAVLHVDDDPMNLRVVEEILGAFQHASVKVMSGAEALQMLAERPFDIVLMDIHMPGMTGIEAVERLRCWAAGRCLSADRPGIYSRAGSGTGTSARAVKRPDPSTN